MLNKAFIIQVVSVLYMCKCYHFNNNISSDLNCWQCDGKSTIRLDCQVQRTNGRTIHEIISPPKKCDNNSQEYFNIMSKTFSESNKLLYPIDFFSLFCWLIGFFLIKSYEARIYGAIVDMVMAGLITLLLLWSSWKYLISAHRVYASSLGLWSKLELCDLTKFELHQCHVNNPEEFIEKPYKFLVGPSNVCAKDMCDTKENFLMSENIKTPTLAGTTHSRNR